MALDIKWSKRADNKFDKILEYLTDEWGETVKKNFIKKVYAFLDILAEFPEIGTVEHEEKGIRGFVIVKQITLFYRINDKNVILLNFFENVRNPKRKDFM